MYDQLHKYTVNPVFFIKFNYGQAFLKCDKKCENERSIAKY